MNQQSNTSPLNPQPTDPENSGKRTKQKRSIATFDRLFRASLQEFRRVGFMEAQVDQITKIAGSSRSSFYFHFPTKDDVLLEVLRRRAEDISERFNIDSTSQHKYQHSAHSKPQSVKAFLDLVLDAVITQVELENDPILMREILALQLRKPTTATEGRRNPIVQMVYTYFQEVSGLGQVRSDLTPADLTKAFMNCIFESLRLYSEDPVNCRSSSENMAKIFVRGISP